MVGFLKRYKMKSDRNYYKRTDRESAHLSRDIFRGKEKKVVGESKIVSNGNLLFNNKI